MSSYVTTKAQEDVLVTLLNDKEVIRGDKGLWSGASKIEIQINTILALFDRRLVRIRCTTSKRLPYLSAVLTVLGERVARDIRKERAEVEKDAA